MTKWAEKELKTLSLGDAGWRASGAAGRAVVAAPWGKHPAGVRRLEPDAGGLPLSGPRDTSGEAVLQAHAQTSALHGRAPGGAVPAGHDGLGLTPGRPRAGAVELRGAQGACSCIRPTRSRPSRSRWGWSARMELGREPRPGEGGARLGSMRRALGGGYGHLVGLARAGDDATGVRGRPGVGPDGLVRARPAQHPGRWTCSCVPSTTGAAGPAGRQAVGTGDGQRGAGVRCASRCRQGAGARRARSSRSCVRSGSRSRRVPIPAQHIEMTCIIATEVDAPAGVQPVVWRLLSNRPVRPWSRPPS